jgi:class 3 adenylate cyclase/tetratricopeptide (TPR) repeat protein
VATQEADSVRTFLIADIRGYTSFTLANGDSAAAELAAKFAAICRDTVESRQGQVLELRGDEALCVFTSVRQAVRAAVELQRRFARETADDPQLPLSVGIGLDSGEAISVEGGFRGTALNLAARLCGRAEAGQILATDTIVALARRLEGISYEELADAQVKGFPGGVRIVEVVATPVLEAKDHVETESVPLPGQLPTGRFLGAIPDGVLVAREQELNTLESLLATVLSGSGRLVVLAGEPGVGKTRLAQEITLRARDLGFQVATGRCYEPHQGVPYYPFLEALASVYRSAPSSVRQAAPQRWPQLARLLPDYIPASIGLAESSEEQQRLLRAITGFLQEASQARPVAILLDDLHWADEASLTVLQHLARNTRQCPILLLATYRDVEINPDHALESCLLDLSRERLVERLPVRRLAREGTARLLAAAVQTEAVSDELSRLVHSHTEGNPFFVEEVVRSMIEHGDIYLENGAWKRRDIAEIEVPESVRSVIGQRVSRMSQDAQELLLQASVFGQTFSFDNLVDLDGRSEDDVERLLDEAFQAGIVQEMGRDAYSFNHALTQQALYARLSSRRKRRLHLAAGEALEQAPDPEQRAAELAWHFLEADDPARVVTYSLLAGDRAAEVFANAEAERHYLVALEAVLDMGDTAREALVRKRLGVIFSTTARYDDAVDAFDRATSLYAKLDDLNGEVEATIRLGQTYRGSGRAEQGIERMTELLNRLEGTEHLQWLGELLIVLETLYFAVGRYADGLGAAERACKLAMESGDMQLLARAEVSRGSQLQMLGRQREAVRVLEAAIPLAEIYTSHPDDLTRGDNLTRALVNLSNGYFIQGHLAESLAAVERVLSMVERTQNPWSISFTLSNLAGACTVMGRWEEARSYLERGVSLSRSVPDSWWAAYPLLESGAFCVLTGEWERASDLLTEVLQVAERNADAQARSVAHQQIARLELYQGRSDPAVARLRNIIEPSRLDDFDIIQAYPVYAEAQFLTGDIAGAEGTLAIVEEWATENIATLLLAQIRLVRGRIFAHQSDWQRAASAFHGARKMAVAMPFPHLAADVSYHRGKALQAEGQLEAAQQSLEESRKEFERLGAGPFAQRSAEALASLDQR